MEKAMPGFKDEIAAIRSRTLSYAADPEFRARWLGVNERAMNLRAQQLRALSTLLCSVANTLAGWRILDVGCGAGFWLRAFLEMDARPEDLVGIDVSDARFELARAKNPLITLLKTDGVTIPFDDGYFDLVTQFVTFSTMLSAALRARVAGEITRVVKSGGFIFWWDHYTIASTDRGTSLRPADFFNWPIRELAVGELPRPSECVTSLEGLGRFLGGLDRLGYPVTHSAALIGPKP
jgi:ubiquinone/menaquinone biosynthesis C-methylase UbiE